jgi:hypothetical protein
MEVERSPARVVVNDEDDNDEVRVEKKDDVDVGGA